MFGPSGFWTMAPLRYVAKFDPFLSLDCAPTPSTLAPEFLDEFPWLKAISRGGLCVPNTIFVDYLREMEDEFDVFHGKPDGIDLEKDVFNRMAKILYDKYTDVPRKVILKYVRFRTFVLIKWLNYQLTLEKAKSKKAKDRPGGRRAARKAKQWST